MFTEPEQSENKRIEQKTIMSFRNKADVQLKTQAQKFENPYA